VADRAVPGEPRRGLRHLPALDGLRGVALLAVLVHHGAPGWLPGGFLAVTWFFALSGFLITGLLLTELEARGRVDVRRFFSRRARRLVPAALLGIAVAAAVGVANGGEGRRLLAGDAAGGVLSVVNWRYALGGHSYQQSFGEPSPLQHLWSLGVEEQVYLGLALAFVALGSRRLPVRARRPALAAVLAAAILGSIGAASVVYRIGELPWRSYFGTDTRGAEPLVGALFAVVLVRAGGVRPVGRVLRALGVAAVVPLALAAWRAQPHDLWLHRGGFAAVSALTCCVIVAATDARSVVARVLSASPLRTAGRVSYSAYILHWPLFLWLDASRTGLAPAPLLLVRVAVTMALASLSLRLVETPIRAGRLTPQVARAGWAAGALGVASIGVAVAVAAPAPPTTFTRATDLAAPVRPAGAGIAAALTAPPAAPPAVATSFASRPGAAETGRPVVAGTRQATPSSSSAPSSPSSSSSSSSPRPGSSTPVPGAAGTTRPSTRREGPLRVAVVGDSQAENLATGLAAWGQTHDVEAYDLSVGGCTLGRGGKRRLATGLVYDIPGECAWWDWDGSPRWKALKTAQPDVIVVLSGMNDSFDRKLDEWPDWRSPGQQGFRAWNVSEFQKAYRMLATSGAAVAAVVPPCDDWRAHPDWQAAAEGDRRMRLMATEIVRPSAAAAGVPLLDLDAQLCPGGRFVADPFGVPEARPDGFHLTDQAAAVVAERWLGPEVLRLGGR
jgi:peptidoglycan/LPS O-acetylase OafA/YrhL/lysophospholipase L1-like esterase